MLLFLERSSIMLPQEPITLTLYPWIDFLTHNHVSAVCFDAFLISDFVEMTFFTTNNHIMFMMWLCIHMLTYSVMKFQAYILCSKVCLLCQHNALCFKPLLRWGLSYLLWLELATVICKLLVTCRIFGNLIWSIRTSISHMTTVKYSGWFWLVRLNFSKSDFWQATCKSQ